jgi:FkbM family methyltransferase
LSTTGARRPEAAPADGGAAALAAAIGQLPSFVRELNLLPTERMPVRDAIDGLGRVRALYDGDLDVSHRPRLQALMAARRGRRCFIVGSGASLERTDLARLRSEVTFATDDAWRKFAELDWLPTYCVVEDNLVAEALADELTSLSGTTKLVPAGLAYALKPDENTVYFDHRPRRSFADGFDFSFDADRNTFAGGTATFTCMQLAAYLGFQEIYLVGVDTVEDVVLGAYAEARRATEAHGVSIVNATVGGKLEVFPRIGFDMLFRSAPAERLLLIDHTQIGNATATGEVKSAILGNWPPEAVMQLYDGGQGRLRLAGGPVEVESQGSLAEQITAFDPDLILYRPVPRTEALHDFAMELIVQTNLPLAVWIVDDWPVTYALTDPDAAARLDADFRWLLARADARFSISPAMSAAFYERYGQPFVPIANGVDPADWPPVRKRPAARIKVRYAGSLAENMTLASVGLVARAIERLGESGLDISFEIKTHPHWHKADADWLVGLQHTRVATSDLSMADYRRWLSDADILLIAYNFDAPSRDYIRYSLANKLPECMASGAMVLAVGPDDIGTIATLAALDVGERVTHPDEALIGRTLRRLAASPDVRFELARRAQDLAFSLFGVAQTRQAFEATVGRVARAHHTAEYPRDLHAYVDETAVVASLLDSRRGADHVMLDVGAHTGSSVVHFERLGWVAHCFEPHPASRAALAARFVARERIHIDPRAVGDAPATNVPLYESSESTGIAALKPFHPTHRAAGRVDVTTLTEVVRELDLSRVDFLKTDVEGLDLAVLKGVPWSRLRPDVIECEFEDAKTLPQGHTWRTIATYLKEQGYAVYVSEWHPIIRYGARHDWRRVVSFIEPLDVHPAAWGNLLAFVDDPGLPALRRAFDRHIERGAAPVAAPPSRARSTGTVEAPAHERSGSQPPTAANPVEAGVERRAVDARPVEDRPAERPTGAARPRPRPFYAPFGRWLKPRAPTLYRLLRSTRRIAAHLLHLWRWTLPVAALLVAWVLAGFTPALASASWLVWGSAVVSVLALASLYASLRAFGSMRAMARDVTQLRKQQKATRKGLSDANATVRRLERALAAGANANDDLRRKVARLEASIAEARAAAPEPPVIVAPGKAAARGKVRKPTESPGRGDSVRLIS